MITSKRWRAVGAHTAAKHYLQRSRTVVDVSRTTRTSRVASPSWVAPFSPLYDSRPTRCCTLESRFAPRGVFDYAETIWCVRSIHGPALIYPESSAPFYAFTPSPLIACVETSVPCNAGPLAAAYLNSTPFWSALQRPRHAHLHRTHAHDS